MRRVSLRLRGNYCCELLVDDEEELELVPKVLELPKVELPVVLVVLLDAWPAAPVLLLWVWRSASGS
jgi:hypothetical protein